MGGVTVSTAQDYHDDSVPGLYKYYALYFLCWTSAEERGENHG